MPIWDYAVELSVILFIATAALLIAASRAGRTRTGRMLALSSFGTVIGADYSMLMAYRGEPALVYERPGPMERRVIKRRGQFEYVDKEDGESDGGGSGGGGAAAAAGGPTDSGSGDGSDEAGAGGSTGSRNGQAASSSPLAALLGLADSPIAAAANTGGTRLGDVIKDCPDCPDLIAVAPGYFRFGAVPGDTDALPGERPQRLVGMSRWYAIGRSEVTVAQFTSFMRATGRAVPSCNNGSAPADPASPIACITQAEAVAYVDWLRVSTGIPYRLPSELEWEWAARGGAEKRFASGEDALTQRPVTNAIGMTGLHGGVAERVGGCWTETTAGLPRNSASGQQQPVCKLGIVRDAATSEPLAHGRLSSRRPSPADQRAPTIGFRIARDL